MSDLQDDAFPDRPWVAIVANPFSGVGVNRRHVERLEAELRRHGLFPLTSWDRDKCIGILRHPRLAAECRCVVAAGGDGTLMSVISERPPVPVAMLPLGNENLFAREFGYTLSAGPLARSIALGKPRAIDLCRADEKVFALVLSVGYDADVVHRVARWRARRGRRLERVTRLSYVRPSAESLLRYRYPEFRLEADGREVAGVLAFVFNFCQYGMRLRFTPGARGDDGVLDWVVLKRPGRLPLLTFYGDVKVGRHLRRSDVVHGRARRIRITSDEPVPVEVDGDPAGTTPVDIEVLPQALRVFVPRYD